MRASHRDASARQRWDSTRRPLACVVLFLLVAGTPIDVFAGSVTTNGASQIGAAGTAELVDRRQRAMREDGQIIKSLGELPPEDSAAQLAKLLQNLDALPALFPKGSISDKSNALPVIWLQFDEFTGIFAEAKLTATTMMQAARSGDSGLYADAFLALKATCGECHQTYRGQLLNQ